MTSLPRPPRSPRFAVRCAFAPLLASAVLCIGCGPKLIDLEAPRDPAAPTRMDLPLPQHPADPVGVAERAIEASRYEEAEKQLANAKPSAKRDRLRAELALVTGAYDEAARLAATVTESPERVAAAVVGAEALRRLGRLDEARSRLSEYVDVNEPWSVRLLLGEILLDQGKDAEAESLLMSLIEAYNDGVIDDRTPVHLALVGRAAQLLGSVHDANDAYNQAEEAGRPTLQTLLWRATLFLENYDTGHAQEVLDDALALAPKHPEVLTRLAETKLAESLDFDSAAELADEALAVDPAFAPAHVIHAGIALRDLDLGRADEHVERGLAKNPKNLRLLSMRAAARFLADDDEGFEAAKQAVLDLNPRYSRLYVIVGEYADWEHRYEEIVQMMREALLADASDAKVRAALGLNLIRLGEDEAGVRALRRAFVDDPFNVRTFNTLELYEKIIPKSYSMQKHGVFRVRYHQDERAVLERYVPELLDDAYKSFRRFYRFRPREPIQVELYPERQHFSVRTSGLPHTYIQGVCFGRTLAAMSPRDESFNFGMTLWHELAHVFHIQLSKSHVPRWFTEGLAEYETMVARPEWKREHDRELYDALRTGRLPEVQRMNRAFSHARDMRDMTAAYYASSQIVAMLAEHYGRESLRKMLVLWGEGKRTEEVIRTALGKTPEEIDREFRDFARKRLARYEGQFVPLGRPDDVEEARRRADAEPKSADALVRLAHALRAAQELEEASQVLDRALELSPKHPDANYLAFDRAVARDAPGEARKHIDALVAAGFDGYDIQMGLAGLAKLAGDSAAEKRSLAEAHRFDPSAAAPLVGLAVLAEKSSDTAAEVEALRKLSVLEEHDGSVVRTLMKRLLGMGQPAEARDVAMTAVYADMEGVETHALYAQALAETGDLRGAVREYEIALDCRGPGEEHAAVHAALAELSDKLGRKRDAAHHRTEAARLKAGQP